MADILSNIFAMLLLVVVIWWIFHRSWWICVQVNPVVVQVISRHPNKQAISWITDTQAIAVATYQTSAAMVYTLYDSSCRQDVRNMGAVIEMKSSWQVVDIIFVKRRHKNMSPCTGSNANFNNGRIASCFIDVPKT